MALDPTRLQSSALELRTAETAYDAALREQAAATARLAAAPADAQARIAARARDAEGRDHPDSRGDGAPRARHRPHRGTRHARHRRPVARIDRGRSGHRAVPCRCRSEAGGRQAPAHPRLARCGLDFDARSASDPAGARSRPALLARGKCRRDGCRSPHRVARARGDGRCHARRLDRPCAHADQPGRAGAGRRARVPHRGDAGRGGAIRRPGRGVAGPVDGRGLSRWREGVRAGRRTDPDRPRRWPRYDTR